MIQMTQKQNLKLAIIKLRETRKLLTELSEIQLIDKLIIKIQIRIDAIL